MKQKRRRAIQENYNEEHHITPKTIKKKVRDLISITKPAEGGKKKQSFTELEFYDMEKDDQKEMLAKLEEQMRSAAKQLDFEQAATLRDTIIELKARIK